MEALIGSGNTDNFLHPNLVDQLSLAVSKVDAKLIQMSSTSLHSYVLGMFKIGIELSGIKYKNIE